MKRSHTAGLAFASLLALSAPALAQDNKAEVMHWWTSGGESAAVKVFADAYTKAAARQLPLNYGFASSWGLARMKLVMDLPSSIPI